MEEAVGFISDDIVATKRYVSYRCQDGLILEISYNYWRFS